MSISTTFYSVNRDNGETKELKYVDGVRAIRLASTLRDNKMDPFSTVFSSITLGKIQVAESISNAAMFCEDKMAERNPTQDDANKVIAYTSAIRELLPIYKKIDWENEVLMVLHTNLEGFEVEHVEDVDDSPYMM